MRRGTEKLNQHQKSNTMKRIIEYITESPAEPASKVVKALLIGFLAGGLAGLVGEDWDFATPYGWPFAGFTFVVVSGALFLKYNSNKT